MKKFIICAAVAVLCASCTGESFVDVEIPEETNVNQTWFENEPDWNVFVNACKSIIQTHKDFENFRDLLDDQQKSFIDGEKFSVDAAVEIIFIWWQNDETGEILVEWPEFDDFICNMPQRFFEKYPFHN